MEYRRPFSLLVVGLVLACAAAEGTDDDRACARSAYEAGEIVSLQAILNRVQAEFAGSPVEIELENDDGRFIYKVKLLAPGGTTSTMRVTPGCSGPRAMALMRRGGRAETDASSGHRASGSIALRSAGLGGLRVELTLPGRRPRPRVAACVV